MRRHWMISVGAGLAGIVLAANWWTLRSAAAEAPAAISTPYFTNVVLRSALPPEMIATLPVSMQTSPDSSTSVWIQVLGAMTTDRQPKAGKSQLTGLSDSVTDMESQESFGLGEPATNGVVWAADRLCLTSNGASCVLWQNLSNSVPTGTISIWSFDTNEVFQSQASFIPPTNWCAVNLVASAADGRLNVVWTNAGAVAFWILNPTNLTYYSGLSYGPFTGWTPQDYKIGALDNQRYLLWNHTDGTVSQWWLNSSNEYTTSFLYGPYAGWWAVDQQVSSLNNELRLLWLNADTTVANWALTNGNLRTAQTYGPYTNWSPLAEDLDATVNGDNRSWLLWTNGALTATCWLLDSNLVYRSQYYWDGFAGWSADNVLARPDQTAFVTWQATNHAYAVHWVGTNADLIGWQTLELGSGWFTADARVDQANRLHVLMSRPDGVISLWKFQTEGSHLLLTNCQWYSLATTPPSTNRDPGGISLEYDLIWGLPTNGSAASAVCTNAHVHGELTNLQVFRNPSVLLGLDYSTMQDDIPDWWKVKYGFSLTDPSVAGADADGDGLTNLQEYQTGTHPVDSDTDDDGLPDAVDAVPLVADTSPPGFTVTSPPNGSYVNP